MADHESARPAPPIDFGFAARFRRPPVLVLLFLVLALPSVLIQVFLTPPIQVPDEENHFLRALQVADGHLFGRKIDGATAGGSVDAGAPTFVHGFDALKFRADVKLDVGAYAAAAAWQWGSGREPTEFPNTAIYPFFLYMPASAGLAAGRAAHLSMLDSFYLGRLATALTSAGLAALALALCGRGRTLLFVVLCFPMSLSLFASVSQDAMAIALGAVAAALWSRYVARGAAMPAPARAIVALALGAVGAARIPLIPLYAIALMPTRAPPPGVSRPRITDCLAAAAGLLPLAIGIYGARAAKIAFREDEGVSPAGQLRWLVLHPAEAAQAIIRTLDENALGHLREMVGILGWLDTELPDGFYTWMGMCVVVALLIDILSSPRSVGGIWSLVPPAAVVTAVVGVFAAFYLAWTPVGAPVVDGVQGRYFLVPAIVLAVSLPGSTPIPSVPPRVVEGARLALCGLVALGDLWVVPITLLHRYYG